MKTKFIYMYRSRCPYVVKAHRGSAVHLAHPPRAALRESPAMPRTKSAALLIANVVVLFSSIIQLATSHSLSSTVAVVAAAGHRAEDPPTSATSATSEAPRRPDLAIRIYLAELPPEYDMKRMWELAGRHGWFHWPTNASPAQPFGRVVSDDGRLWTTNQFAAELIVYHNLLRWPLRVRDISQADLVYVPTFLGATVPKDPALFGGDAALAEQVAQLGERFAANLSSILPYLQRLPHLVVLHYEKSFRGPDAVLGSPLAPYISALVTEVAADLPHDASLTLPGVPPLRGGPPPVGFYGNAISIPYPAFVHHHRGCDACFHQDVAAVAQRKNLTVFSVFNSRRHFGPGPWAIRDALIEQCRARPGRCHQLTHNQASNREEVLDLAEAMERSWFCLQPHGDTPTRKSVYDGLMVTCIPVVFDQVVLDSFPFREVYDPSKIVVLAPRAGIENGTSNIVDYLEANYPLERRLQMVAEILRVRHIYQWSQHPDPRAASWDTLHTFTRRDDALTMAIKRAVHGSCVRGFPGRFCGAVRAGQPIRAGTDAARA
ncbi:hypothetical protein PLESTF_001059200 [Pleodorina starrii]|nr:hypothetical protein PLESTF_001059200 [Pleodorina starrii]